MSSALTMGNKSAAGESGTGGSLRHMVEHSPAGMAILNRAGDIESVNPALARIYGEKMARARKVEELVDCANLDAIAHARALDYWRKEAWAGPGHASGPASYVGRVDTPDGTREVVFGSLVVGEKVVAVLGEPDDWVGTLGLELANKAVQESEAKYRRLCMRMMDAFAIADRDGRMTEVNEAFELLVGYSAEELKRMTYPELTPGKWHAAETRILEEQVLPRGYSDVFEKEYRRKDGTIIPVELRVSSTRDENGNLLETWAVVRDITERKRLEVALQKSNAQLEERYEAKLAAQHEALADARRMALRSEISAGVVHQIGQPLTAIGNSVAAAKLAIDKCIQQDCGAAGLLQDTANELGRIRSTMAHLQSLAHPERQNRAPANLNALLEQTLQLVRAGTDCMDTQVEMDLAPDLPMLSIDSVQMIQVFGNLLQNACDAVAIRPSGERVVTIATRVADPEWIEACVTDTGPGISADDEALLFEPFFTTKASGTGIGLPLVLRIVTAHGGRIEGFNNGDQPGATFRVLLPVERPGS